MTAVSRRARKLHALIDGIRFYRAINSAPGFGGEVTIDAKLELNGGARVVTFRETVAQKVKAYSWGRL